ncbi:MAG: methyl-accepting chemotaxis protein [Acidobacteriota bacterium]
MKIAWKLILIIVLMAVPTVFAVYLFVVDTQDDIAKADLENVALEYLIDLRQFFQHVPQHRGTAAGVIGGDTTQRASLQRLAATVNNDLVTLAEIDAELGARLDTTERFEQLRNDWKDLEPRATSLSGPESFARHTTLIADTMALMRHIANTGKLVSDPDVDSSHLITAIVERIPDVAENMGVLRGLGNGIAARGVITLDEQIRLSELIARIRSGVVNIDINLRAAIDANPELEAELMQVLTDSTGGVESFLRLAETRILRAEVMTVPAADYFAAGTEAIDRFFVLYDASLTSTQRVLAERSSRLEFLRNLQLGLAIGLALVALGLAFFFQRGITRQIDAIGAFFGQVGIGNFEARADVTSTDELGDLATNLNATFDAIRDLLQTQEDKEKLQSSIQKLLIEVSDVADGDLTVEAEVTEEVTGAIADSFNYMIDQLRQIIYSVQDTTLQVSSAATEVQATTEHLAEGSEAQAEQIVNASSAVDELALSIQQVSENATTAATVAEQATVNAQQGTSSVGQTITGMNAIRQQVQETSKRIKRLGESSQEIGEIVGLIGDIADRTSILALNASIQAAMAGEAGRGFAVVAEEVERLAERSAEATKRISGLIKTIQSETSEAVAAMEETTREVVSGSGLANEAGQALAEIEAVSNRLAEIIGSISMSANQQARGSESVARAMNEISDVTQQTAAGTKQAAVSIRNLAEMADDLRGSVSTFKLPGRA